MRERESFRQRERSPLLSFLPFLAISAFSATSNMALADRETLLGFPSE